MRRPVTSRRVYTGRHISLRLDELEFPNRHRVVYEIVEHRGAAAMVALTGDRRLLLVRQFRPAVGEELLEIPAGTIEEGETPEACARRELAEEVGHAAGRWERLISYYPSPGVLSEQLHVFLAQDLHPAPAPREEEDLRVESLPLADAYRRIAAGEIRDAKSIIGITAAWERFRPAG